MANEKNEGKRVKKKKHCAQLTTHDSSVGPQFHIVDHPQRSMVSLRAWYHPAARTKVVNLGGLYREPLIKWPNLQRSRTIPGSRSLLGAND